jgi:hypothetical protein
MKLKESCLHLFALGTLQARNLLNVLHSSFVTRLVVKGIDYLTGASLWDFTFIALTHCLTIYDQRFSPSLS